MVAKSVGLASSHVLAGKIAISTFDDGAHCAIGWAVLIAVVSALVSGRCEKVKGLQTDANRTDSCPTTASGPA